MIGYLEETLYRKVANELVQQYGEYFMKFWNSFLNDCFVPWTRSLNDLNRLHYILSSLHPSINFTIECSQNELPFLNVFVKKNNTSIDTDIYFKPTYSQQYLIFDSCHPKHIKSSIPNSLARRLKMIISSGEKNPQRMLELKHIILKQKYLEMLLMWGFREL